jgi:hypothetical protein
MTLFPVPVCATAQNNPSCGDQHTDVHVLSIPLVELVVQIVPSTDVITLSPVPFCETAHNNPSCGDQHTDAQLLFDALFLIVQVFPSNDVITLFPVPEPATAQNIFNCGDQHTEFQVLLTTLCLVVHVLTHDRVVMGMVTIDDELIFGRYDVPETASDFCIFAPPFTTREPTSGSIVEYTSCDDDANIELHE